MANEIPGYVHTLLVLATVVVSSSETAFVDIGASAETVVMVTIVASTRITLIFLAAYLVVYTVRVIYALSVDLTLGLTNVVGIFHVSRVANTLIAVGWLRYKTGHSKMAARQGHLSAGTVVSTSPVTLTQVAVRCVDAHTGGRAGVGVEDTLVDISNLLPHTQERVGDVTTVVPQKVKVT